MNVLFVCLGNICRSPLAEGILKEKYQKKGIQATVESRGFESFHINEAPDIRAIETAKKHQIDISHLKASLFTVEDFDRFDRIYVMDTQNFRDVKDLARGQADEEKIDYVLNVIKPGINETVPDPYYSGIDDCEKVYNLLEKACDKIAEEAVSFKKA